MLDVNNVNNVNCENVKVDVEDSCSINVNSLGEEERMEKLQSTLSRGRGLKERMQFGGLKQMANVQGSDALIISQGLPLGIFNVTWLDKNRKLYFYPVGWSRKELTSLRAEIDDQSQLIVVRKEAINIFKQPNVIAIIYGSVLFVECFLRDASCYRLNQGIVIVPYCRFRKGELRNSGLKWHKVSHTMVGGATTQAFSLGIPDTKSCSNVPGYSLSYGLTRHLRHCIKDGNSGRVVDPPREDLLTQPFRPTQLQKMFTLPCFKSRTGWVIRELTFFEVGLLYDVNELKLRQLGDLLKESKTLYSNTCPGKLWQVCDAVIVSLWGKLKVLESQPVLPPAMKDNDSLGNLIFDGSDLSGDQPKKTDPFLEKEAEYLIEYGQKAAKADNAIIPVELWDRSILRNKAFHWLPYSARVATALNTLRQKFAWRLHIVFLVRSFFRYLISEYGSNWTQIASQPSSRKRPRNGSLSKHKIRAELLLDLKIGIEGLLRALRSDWWNWNNGSTCYFWRWPRSVQKCIRDGFNIFVTNKLPQFLKKQNLGGTKLEQELLKGKVEKVMERGYLERGYVKSLINYFSVPKGADDVRVVYDGTKSGLTDATWAPNFFMPSLSSLLMYCSPSTWYSDMDLGEMFLNYFMQEKLRPFSGVDVSRLLGKGWVRWNRTFMGFRASPYLAVKAFGFTTDVIRGDRTDETNPFGFTHVSINLPGQASYNPALPWICKMHGKEESADVVVYMDDIRPFGGSEMRCRRAGKKASKATQYLGQQDASRKYRPPSQRPGPWCGAFVAVANGSVWNYVSEEKWRKAKTIVETLNEEIKRCKAKGEPISLNHKNLEKGRGFLVYLSRTYDPITPYLKGIHLSLDSWRKNRDKDGWKMKPHGSQNGKVCPNDAEEGGANDAEWECEENEFYWDKEEDDSYPTVSVAPEMIKAVPRLESDLQVLSEFFAREKAPWRFIRGKEISVVHYGFADASSSGFGSSFQTPDGILYRFGNWSKDEGQESSNFRELANLVFALEERLSDQEELRGLEIFLFTDNIVAEGAFHKGTSSSKKLFDLVVRLRKLEMFAGCIIHVIHIAGSRMIEQGTDGLSRGDVNEGIMKGKLMTSFIPLNQSCLDRSPGLKTWIKAWLSPYARGRDLSLDFLRIEDWFTIGHDIVGGETNQDGVWMPKYQASVKVWTPPPALGQAAIEQLRQARLKRTESTHIFLLPRVFTSRWKKQLHRAADLTIELPFLPVYWSQDLMHEPLTIAFFFPFVTIKPWQLKRSYAFLGMARTMRGLWREAGLAAGFVLHQFCAWAGKLPSMPDGLVREVLQSPRTFKLSCS